MKYRRICPIIIFVFVVGSLVLSNISSLKQNKITQFSLTDNQISVSRETAKVLRVVDGDTIRVLINNKEETVRLIGIDSPEVLDERKSVQCFGKEASAKAKEILTGKTIVLQSDPVQGERDEYGRLLRYVFLNNLNFNKLMVSEGYAHEYTFKGNPYEYQLEFKDAERGAQKNKKGLWANDVCN